MRSYDEYCAIAKSLDVIGDRWTLLIVRELALQGRCRYTDLRNGLPGIATNLLADRLRELEQVGLIERRELPPPVARTVYSLSAAGWRKVPPVIQAIATFGLDLIEPNESALTPLNGFLAGILLGFDRRTDLNASYRVDIDGRRFEFGVDQGHLTATGDRPAVTVKASAADLITARIGSTAAQRKSARRRITFDGDKRAVDTMSAAFQLD